MTDDGGIKKKILVSGNVESGTPPFNADVTCHYVGTLTENGNKFEFKLGIGRVIQCWDRGIATYICIYMYVWCGVCVCTLFVFLFHTACAARHAALNYRVAGHQSPVTSNVQNSVCV